MRVAEVTKPIYRKMPEFFRRFGRPLRRREYELNSSWLLHVRASNKNCCRWFVVMHEPDDVIGFLVLWRCFRPAADDGDKTDLHYRVSDLLVLPEHQSSKAAKLLINKIVRLGVAESAAHISIDVAPEDMPFFTENGFAPRTDAISLTRMMPWLEYDKPKMYPATTLSHSLNCTLAAEPSDSPAS